MHQNSFQSIRKKAFRKACSKVHRTQDSVSYRGGELTPEFLRRSGLEPPPLPLLSGATLSSSPTPTPATFRSRPRGGQASKHLRVLSWNAGHLGVQQWAEIRTWLREDSSSVCDVLVLQETHWNETAEFDVEGWHCISSAKKGAARAPKKKAAPGQRPEMKAASQQDPQLDTSRADGVMVLLSNRIPANQVRWREIRKGRLLQVIFPWMGTRVHLAAVYQHAWSSKKTNQQNKEDRAKLLGEISSLIRSIPCRNTFLLAGDFNARLSPHEGLIGPCSTAADQFAGRISSGPGDFTWLDSLKHLVFWPGSHVHSERLEVANRLLLHYGCLGHRESKTGVPSESPPSRTVEAGRPPPPASSAASDSSLELASTAPVSAPV